MKLPYEIAIDIAELNCSLEDTVAAAKQAQKLVEKEYNNKIRSFTCSFRDEGLVRLQNIDWE